MESYSLDINNITSVYGALLSSINTIWYIYVLVYLGAIGWLLVRARDLSRTQKLVSTFTITVFSLIIAFYFYDAYADLERLMVDFNHIANTNKLLLTEGGFFNHISKFDYDRRRIFSFFVLSVLWLLLVIIMWYKGIWKQSPDKRDDDLYNRFFY